MNDTNISQKQNNENEIIKKFVTIMPYPNHTEMLENLNDYIDLWCEYGEKNHICCKIIYENPTDKNLIIKMGKTIYELGGMQALSANHSVLQYFSPYWKSTNINIQMQGRMIAEYFQDVTPEWKT
jgi:hypothetical protein